MSQKSNSYWYSEKSGRVFRRYLRKKGFTLIELLVVISVIALLLSVLMPALNKTKEQAKSVICISNLKQMHLGVVLYARDNNDKPFDYDYSRGLYLQRMVNYLDKIEKIRYCPSTKVGRSEGAADLGRWPDLAFGTARMTWWEFFIPNPNEDGKLTQEYGSYAYNGWMYTELSDGVVGTSTEEKVFENMNASPGGNIPLIMDSTFLDIWPLDTDTPSPEIDLYIGEWPPSMGLLWIDRHNMRCNTVFLDGHTVGIHLDDLWKLKWHKQFKYRSDIRF